MASEVAKEFWFNLSIYQPWLFPFRSISSLLECSGNEGYKVLPLAVLTPTVLLNLFKAACEAGALIRMLKFTASRSEVYQRLWLDKDSSVALLWIGKLQCSVWPPQGRKSRLLVKIANRQFLWLRCSLERVCVDTACVDFDWKKRHHNISTHISCLLTSSSSLCSKFCICFSNVCNHILLLPSKQP